MTSTGREQALPIPRRRARQSGARGRHPQTQYYQTINGYPEHIQNPEHQLAGIWWDNSNPIHDNVTGLELAVLGHEVEETVTDPGAEDVINGVNHGGWCDYSGYENGDKCAWVGVNATGVGPGTAPIPGAVGFMRGDDGQQYPVQQLWSNASLQGRGLLRAERAADGLGVTR